jgi:hypothetical protein
MALIMRSKGPRNYRLSQRVAMYRPVFWASARDFNGAAEFDSPWDMSI